MFVPELYITWFGMSLVGCREEPRNLSFPIQDGDDVGFPDASGFHRIHPRPGHDFNPGPQGQDKIRQSPCCPGLLFRCLYGELLKPRCDHVFGNPRQILNQQRRRRFRTRKRLECGNQVRPSGAQFAGKRCKQHLRPGKVITLQNILRRHPGSYFLNHWYVGDRKKWQKVQRSSPDNQTYAIKFSLFSTPSNLG